MSDNIISPPPSALQIVKQNYLQFEIFLASILPVNKNADAQRAIVQLKQSWHWARECLEKEQLERDKMNKAMDLIKP